MISRRYFFDNDYDSELGYPNEYNCTEFKLIVRLHFDQNNPKDGDKIGYAPQDDDEGKVPIQQWTDAEWEKYKRVKTFSEKYLNRPYNRLGVFPQARPHDKMSETQYKSSCTDTRSCRCPRICDMRRRGQDCQQCKAAPFLPGRSAERWRTEFSIVHWPWPSRRALEPRCMVRIYGSGGYPGERGTWCIPP